MNNEPLATVVIPTCNRPALLGACLDAIAVAVRAAGEGCNLQVVVTDDSADDASERLVATSYPWVTWVRGPRRGPAANRNCGARLARGRWLVFTDDDCLAEPGWLAALIGRIGRPPECNVLEGKTVPDRRRLRLDEESPANTAGGYLWSCNMAIRRSFFEGLGGFCETFPCATMEDIDLALRILGGGERFEFVPEAVVCHPYRTAKGVRFLHQAGASFLHLVERHPQLLGVHPWRTFCAVSLRRATALIREAFACRGRGLNYGLAYFAVWTYFEFVARARRTQPLATVPSAWPTQHER